MEYGLWQQAADKALADYLVLILVLMEYGLWRVAATAAAQVAKS